MNSYQLLKVIEQAAARGDETLNLSRMSLTALPPEIGKLVNLKQLILSHNKLVTLPPEIGALHNLEVLEIGHNKLSKLPPELFELQSLIRLGLMRNELSSIPSLISKLTRLADLSLGNNNLVALPPEVGQLKELSILRLNRTNIPFFHDELIGLDKLETLSLIGLKNLALLKFVHKFKNLKVLDVAGSNLVDVPLEICELTSLRKLILSRNKLNTLPREIGKLTNLNELVLEKNRLTTLPPEIGNLKKLNLLKLTYNELTTLPKEMKELKELTSLDLTSNHIKTLPEELNELPNLTTITIIHNNLTSFPEGLSSLNQLLNLDLRNNKLSTLPPEISGLSKLNVLNLENNKLTSLPPEIGSLSSLTSLVLSSNHLRSLPREIGNLSLLRTLIVTLNNLRELPASIGQLTNLRSLVLSNNELASIPVDIGNLYNLRKLSLRNNQLSMLPVELGKVNISSLDIRDNPITSPPPEILEQGETAILAFLRESLKGGTRQWLSKVLVVGEGGVGKTSLLRALRGESFNTQESTTHGIEIGSLELSHPTEPEVEMQLNTWDFGGQEIYHATHQFFLTNRSLFVLAWNARLGFEQGRLYYWLDTIKARAPESPVLLIATFTDEREANIPLSDLQRKYPQILGHWEISNKTGYGIDQLRQGISEAAASLPLMGEIWPSSWLEAANELRSKSFSNNYITPNELWAIMAQHKVINNKAKLLAQWVHELGDILFFQDDEELNDVVILNPQWVTESISKVLESDEVINNLGLFTLDHMNTLWSEIDPAMRGHFLRLMEKFDLSYRTLENRDISLVVERLSLDPPNYNVVWDAIRQEENCNEIKMKFLLNTTTPAGIPTWFIARTHRFTTRTHWRYGALFADGPERKHLGLIQSFPHDRYLLLSVRGPIPHNFFALLRDGLELTLSRFPGLKIDRKVPCLGHNGQYCSHEFDLSHLQTRIERRPPKPDIECPVALENVSVPRLLFGLHWNTINEDIRKQYNQIMSGVERLGDRMDEMITLVQREFIKIYRLEQSKIESYCPNIFVLRPMSGNWLQGVYKQKVELQLYCQEPGEWHMTENGGVYVIEHPAEWLAVLSPYLQKLGSVFKYAMPLVGPWVGVQSPDHYKKKFENDIKLMEEMVKKLPEIEHEVEGRNASEKVAGKWGYSELSILIDESDLENYEGASLRILRKLLDEKDPKHQWGGLRKVLTPEGHYLWLCEHHARKYLQ